MEFGRDTLRRRGGRLLLFLFVGSLWLLPPPAYGQAGGAFPPFTWGGAPKGHYIEGLGMNDPFSSVANPAALVNCGRDGGRHVAVEQIKPFGVPITGLAWCGKSYGGHVIVRQTPAGLGFDYNTYTVGLTKAWSFGGDRLRLAVGVTPKLLFVSIAETGIGLDDEGFGYGLDGGIVAAISGRGRTWLAGLAMRDGVSRLRYGSGAAETAAPPLYVAGVAVAGASWTVGAGARVIGGEVQWRVGGEYVLGGDQGDGGWVALRAGLADGEAAFGIGLSLFGFGVDYAYSVKGVGENDGGVHGVSTNIRF